MRTRILIGAAAALFVAAAVWQFAFAPRWTHRLSPGWRWQTKFVGLMGEPDPKTQKLPERDTTGAYERESSAAPLAGHPRELEVRDRYTLRDPLNGRISFDYRYSARVDPATGAHTSEAYRGDYYVFPRHVQKSTYRLRNNYLEGVPVSFAEEAQVNGLSTYVFHYLGAVEYTKSYAGSPEYPGIKVPPGQAIRCDQDQFELRIWVEPVSGEMIKIYEGCPSADVVYDTKTGVNVSTVMRWRGEIEGDSVMRLTVQARQERQMVYVAGYSSYALLALGFLCLVRARQGARRTPVEDQVPCVAP